MQTVRFVSAEMHEAWRNDEDFTDELYREAVGAGVLSGLAWPVLVPLRLLSDLLYRISFAAADRRFRAAGGSFIGPAGSDVTGEIARIKAQIPSPSAEQKRLKRQAEKGRAEFAKKAAAEPSGE